MSSEPTPLQRKIEYIRANARYHEGGRNAGATHDHGECLLLDAYEAEREAVFAAQRERQDALDQKRWAEADPVAAYRADLIEKVRALPGNGSRVESSTVNTWSAGDSIYRVAVLRLLTDGAEPPERVEWHRGTGQPMEGIESD